MSSGPNGGLIDIYNKNGKITVEMRSEKDGGIVGVSNERSRRFTAMMADTKNGGQIITFDANGKFTWSVPPPPTITTTIMLPPSSRGSTYPSTTLPPTTSLFPSSGIYPSTGPGHWIKSISANGRIVTLEDNSVWEISELDRLDVSLWLPSDDITVVDNPLNPFYPYKLINTDQGETAEAKLLSR